MCVIRHTLCSVEWELLGGGQWRTILNEPDADAAYRDSAAAKLLAEGLANAASERGLSQRAIAKQLGYKQSVVLSHMALGRVPIPIERAEQFAEALMLDKQNFLVAVLHQRYPKVDWRSMLSPPRASNAADDLVKSLEAILDGPLDLLSDEQAHVMREVASDKNASNRWLSVHEIPAVSLLRSLRPKIWSDGLSPADRESVRQALT